MGIYQKFKNHHKKPNFSKKNVWEGDVRRTCRGEMLIWQDEGRKRIRTINRSFINCSLYLRHPIVRNMLTTEKEDEMDRQDNVQNGKKPKTDSHSHVMDCYYKLTESSNQSQSIDEIKVDFCKCSLKARNKITKQNELPENG